MTEKLVNPSLTSPPVPDPTILTTEQLLREVSTLREQFGREVADLKELTDIRHVGLDKALVLSNTNMLQQITHLGLLCDEKFNTIAIQFKERDTRVEQTAKDTKVAVDAALQADEK